MAIVSFQHKFIFIKTAKTAGSSLEVHLAAQCGPDDIVTPIKPPNPDHHPRNFMRPAGEFTNHMPAREIQRMEPEAFAESFKFCFERHPIDKCLSHFAMLLNSPVHQRGSHPKSWEEYLSKGKFPMNARKYTDRDGNLMVDRIFRYEELDAALKELESIVGVTFGPLLAQEKTGFRHGVPTVAEVQARPDERKVIFDAFEKSLRFTPYD